MGGPGGEGLKEFEPGTIGGREDTPTVKFPLTAEKGWGPIEWDGTEGPKRTRAGKSPNPVCRDCPRGWTRGLISREVFREKITVYGYKGDHPS